MRKLLLVACFAVLMASNALAQVSAVPEKYKDLRWRSAETQNFEIRAMDVSHASQLKERVEQLKTWIHDRWMLHDVPFNKKCMIICVSDQDQFREFWKMEDADPAEATSKNRDGVERQVYAIWIAADSNGNWLTKSLPEKVGRVCLLNYESVHGAKIGMWAHLGMSALDNDVTAIATLLQGIDPQDTGPSANTILNLTRKDYAGKSATEKLMLKRQATAFTLFLRKEFGPKRFLAFMDSGADMRAARQVYGFETDNQFESSYHTYGKNLVYDLRAGVTPTSYLTWGFTSRKAD